MARWRQPVDPYLTSPDWLWVRSRKRCDNEEENDGKFLCERCGVNLAGKGGLVITYRIRTNIGSVIVMTISTLMESGDACMSL